MEAPQRTRGERLAIKALNSVQQLAQAGQYFRVVDWLDQYPEDFPNLDQKGKLALKIDGIKSYLQTDDPKNFADLKKEAENDLKKYTDELEQISNPKK